MSKWTNISIGARDKNAGSVFRIAKELTKRGWHFTLQEEPIRFSYFPLDADGISSQEETEFPSHDLGQLEGATKACEAKGQSYFILLFWRCPECEIMLRPGFNPEHLIDIHIRHGLIPGAWSNRLTDHNWWLERIVPSVEIVCGEVTSLVFEESWG